MKSYHFCWLVILFLIALSIADSDSAGDSEDSESGLSTSSPDSPMDSDSALSDSVSGEFSSTMLSDSPDSDSPDSDSPDSDSPDSDSLSSDDDDDSDDSDDDDDSSPSGGSDDDSGSDDDDDDSEVSDDSASNQSDDDDDSDSGDSDDSDSDSDSGDSAAHNYKQIDELDAQSGAEAKKPASSTNAAEIAAYIAIAVVCGVLVAGAAVYALGKKNTRRSGHMMVKDMDDGDDCDEDGGMVEMDAVETDCMVPHRVVPETQ